MYLKGRNEGNLKSVSREQSERTLIFSSQDLFPSLGTVPWACMNYLQYFSHFYVNVIILIETIRGHTVSREKLNNCQHREDILTLGATLTESYSFNLSYSSTSRRLMLTYKILGPIIILKNCIKLFGNM